MSDKDVDAQFADIIAHWDDVETLPDAQPAAEPDPQPADETPEQRYAGGAGPERPSPERPSPERPSPERPAREPSDADEAASTSEASAAEPPPVLGDWPVWRGATGATPRPELEDQDDDEHFEPGPTAPLPPQEDIQFWAIIVGLVGGPLLLLWLVLFRPSVSGWWTLLALGLTIGGFVLLVMRQPHSRDEDDPDNGARL